MGFYSLRRVSRSKIRNSKFAPKEEGPISLCYSLKLGGNPILRKERRKGCGKRIVFLAPLMGCGGVCEGFFEAELMNVNFY
jgi:hypothetical protein